MAKIDEIAAKKTDSGGTTMHAPRLSTANLCNLHRDGIFLLGCARMANCNYFQMAVML